MSNLSHSGTKRLHKGPHSVLSGLFVLALSWNESRMIFLGSRMSRRTDEIYI